MGHLVSDCNFVEIRPFFCPYVEIWLPNRVKHGRRKLDPGEIYRIVEPKSIIIPSLSDVDTH